LPTGSGGTGLASFTSGGVVYASSTSALTTGSALSFDGTTLNNSGAFGSSTAAFTLKNTSASSTSNIVEQQFWAGNTFSGLVSIAAFGADTSTSVGNQYGSFYWKIANAGAPTEQMRLTSTGLGIGTSSPSYKLDVSVGTNTIAQQWQGAGTSFTLRLKSGNGATSSSSAYRLYLDYLNGTNINSYMDFYRGLAGNDGYLVFGTSGTDRMTLDSSGNLGLGVTPSAWGSSQKAVQVGNYALVSTSGAYGGSYTSNAYYDNTNWKYITSDYATNYNQVSGIHKWFTAPSGTAGATVSFTQAMTLDNSGNLLVGTTSSTTTPASGVQLNNGSSIGTVAVGHASGTATGNYYASFAYNSSIIGSITQSGTTAVLYNTSSDVRLKENIVDADSASSLIDALQVRQFDWKEDGSHQRYGFIAQELATVAPEAVHQPTEPEQMMGVDYSKLVPMLVKEIQSLRSRVAQLESQLKG